MRYFLSTLALTAFASYATALGINCQGSSSCVFFHNPDNPHQGVADSLRQEIAAHVSDTRLYQNGQHVVCVDGEVGPPLFTTFGSICAFLQGTGGIHGKDIKVLAQRIVEHSCKACGSVPVFFDQGDNDVNSHGQLTFNFVDRIPVTDVKCKSIGGHCQYD